MTWYLNIQKCGNIVVCSFDKMRNDYIFLANLSHTTSFLDWSIILITTEALMVLHAE